MPQTCPGCGEENPDRFRVCGMCGEPLAIEVTPEEVRKTISVVFSDLKGSTTLGEQLDTESLREVLRLYFGEMQAVLERHGGTVEKYIGDAIMAVFGLPAAHEDDALRAVRAAYEMKETLARVNEKLEAGWGVRLENRTGVNTGEVVAGDVTTGQRLVTGDTVNTAARLEQAAPTLEILIGEPTYRLVKDAVEVEPVEPLELKGKAERVPAYRLISVRREEGVARRLDAPMVGRDRELASLLDALEITIGRREPQLVTVFGEAGVGKSRLLREFFAKAGERVQRLRGRCLSYGEGITFWPLAEVVRSAADISDDDSLDQARAKLTLLLGEDAADVAERIGSAIGFTSAPFPVQETFWAARRFFEVLAARTPLVVDFEDIHWAEETFLDLIRYVVDSETDSQFMVVCSARKDLVLDRPDWGREGPRNRSMVLEPLSEEESERVVENLLGSRLDQAVKGRIIEAAEGNPLFVEQMLSMLIDDGVIARSDRGDWILLSEPGAITIPPTIAALLTSRLDRLSSAERSVIERGAVVGQTFYTGAVEYLVPPSVAGLVHPSLASLTRKELIRPHDSAFAGQDSFRFVHILVRDAAYAGLLKRSRAELHERFVNWLEAVASDRIAEYEEIRGYHLEQAYLIRIQLAPIDDRVRDIGRRGAEYLSSAGARAVARGDMPAAAGLLRRAASLLPEDDPKRPRLLIEAGRALLETGEFVIAESVLTSALEAASAIGDRGVEIAARLETLNLHLAFAPDQIGSEERVVQEVERAIAALEGVQDHHGLARAWQVLMNVHLTALRFGMAEDALRKRVEQLRIAGDEVTETRVLPGLAMMARYGPTHVSTAIEVCTDILGRVQGDRQATAETQRTLAHLHAMEGRFDVARDLYPGSRAMLEEMGWRFDAALTSIDSGPIEMLAGDLVAAERELRRDYEALEAMDSVFLPTTGGYLAEALYRQGRLEEAEKFTRVAEERTAADDILSQVLWREVRGKLMARRGRGEEGERLGRKALDLIRQSEDVYTLGNVLFDLAETLVLAGNDVEAAGFLREAVEVFERKGNVVMLERARTLLEQISHPSRPGPGGIDRAPVATTGVGPQNAGTSRTTERTAGAGPSPRTP